MSIVTLLEQLAVNVHHSISVEAIIKGQSDAVQKAFLMNDANLLKDQLGSTLNLADRTTIVQIK